MIVYKFSTIYLGILYLLHIYGRPQYAVSFHRSCIAYEEGAARARIELADDEVRASRFRTRWYRVWSKYL